MAVPATPALPGLFCCISALILLIFATISSPVWNDVFFLEVTVNGSTTRFGAFGYTGSPKQLGYYIDLTALGFTYVLPYFHFHFHFHFHFRFQFQFRSCLRYSPQL